MKQTFERLFRFLTMTKEDYPYIAHIAILNGAVSGLIPFVNLWFYARILGNLIGHSFYAAGIQALIMIVITFAMGVIRELTQHKLKIFSSTVEDSVRRQVSDKAYIMEYDRMESLEDIEKLRATWIGVMSAGGIDNIIRGLSEFVSASVSLLSSAGLIAALFYRVRMHIGITSPWPWILIAGFVVSFGASMLAYSRLSAKMTDIFEKNTHINAVSGYLSAVSMSLAQKKDLMLYDLGGLVMEHRAILSGSLRLYGSFAKERGRLFTVFGFAPQIYIAISYIFVGSLAFAGAIGISEVLLYAGALSRISDGMQLLMTGYFDMSFRLGLMDVFYDFINQQDMHYDGTLPVEKRSDNDYELEFKNVSFAYPGSDREVLKNISLKLRVGERLALVGRNGAGKTTLVKLLCRLYEPTKGEILLNGINIRKYDYAEYTSIFAPVFQDYKLFSLSIKENVCCDTEGDLQRLNAALEKAGMLSRVNELPEGADTLLYHDNGEGVDVSGGEAQKLAIARAWYKDAPFVILDEPTAALDPVAEAQVYENFNALVGDKTAIYISHRMSSCRFCDKIVVLKDGRIDEMGTHESLLEADGEYALLFNTQAKYYGSSPQ